MTLGAVSTLIFDLDGVIWRGGTPIDSAITAVNDLRSAGKRCMFCTNNSSLTQAAFVDKLQKMGVEDVSEEDIITSSTATALYLSAQYTGPFLAYVIGGEGINAALSKIGARIVPDIDITEETNVDCVVAGIDRTFTYEKLDTAQRLIRRGALFVATNRDATYPVEDGVIPGAGSIVSAIETASGVTPVTVGKPRPVMIQLVMQKYGLQPNELAFIGDRLDTDIVCARRAGVAALLVTTGVTTLQQARRAKGELRPDAVFDDLSSFAELVMSNSPTTPLEMDNLPSVEEPAAPATETAAVEGATITGSAPESETVPESAPFVEEAAAETQDTTNWADFSMDTSIAREDKTTEGETAGADTAEAKAPEAETPETQPVETETAEVAPAPESEAPDETPAAPAEEKSGEWDDSWFDGNADANPPETPAAEEAPANEAESDEKPKEKPDAASTPGDGFDWKLD